MDRREMLGLFGALGTALPLMADDHEAKKEPHLASSPLAGPHAHFCGIHMAKKDPRFQLITQHYCTAHSQHDHDDMFQCILFDKTGPNAKLLGVEYIVSDAVYRKLPDEEKKYWHAHTYEVLGGGLIAPGMSPDDEMKFMKMILTTWGKAWHTWPDPSTAVPLGEPLLIWSLMGDGQVSEKVVAARDKEFKCSTAKIRESRGKAIGYEVPSVGAPKNMEAIGRQWTNDGEDKPTRKR
jgi:hypothetical protein